MYEKYNRYKDSGVEWLGMVPEHWEIIPNKFIFHLKKNLVGKKSKDYTLLSLTLNGIIERDMINPQGKFPAEFDTYQEVKKNDFVFCLFDVEETPRCVGLSKFEGMITGAYTVFEVSDKFNKRFLYYFYINLDNDKRLKPLYTGLRNTISKDNFFTFKTFIPPLSEQTSIASFLDKKTSQIDHAIELKEKTIALLKERKQIVIQELVTGKWKIDNEEEIIDNGELKIDNARLIKRDEAEMKDSGVEWIGMVPKSWEVKRLKYICNINKDTLPDTTLSDYELEYIDIGNVSFENGIERSELYTFRNAPSRARRRATKGSTIISTVRTYLKAIDYINQNKSKYIFSTGFAVLEPNEPIKGEFLYNFVLSDAFTEQVSYNSKGMSYPAINSTELGKLFLLVPELTEQTQIIYHAKLKVKQIDNAISLQEQEIEKLKELKATLIDSAVTGKIKIVDNG